MLKKGLMLASLCLLSGCLTTNGGGSSNTGSASFVHYGQSGGAQSLGMHTVMAGDTVYNVAQRYNLALQDVINANQLQPPYALAEGARLKLTPPQSYKAKDGDTVETVARMFNVSASQLTRMNNLHAPYRLAAGQSVRLPPAIKMPPPLMTSEMLAQRKTVSSAGGMAQGRYPSGAYDKQSVEMSAAPPPSVEREVLTSPAPVMAEPSGVPAQAMPSQKTVDAALVSVPARASGKFAWPVDGPVISGYGPKSDGRSNDGINIRVPKGTPVRAAENGVVAYSGDDLPGYGNLVLIRHADRWMTAYGHLDSVIATKGMTINRGQTIGTVGKTGSVDSPQLHFEVRRGTEALNPEPYLAHQGS
ncbi:MAG: LysM peptidoglycan-binding domain-containing M23 family metallopeptidase [Micavibrio aeruginosavorus]|uniref:LysM peptidoglycan-binding domain-containing M23 family metallopeptidase n=1 Tax=Micavibrio aeruginosavorus TaxID=349221 RepID=A0A7T5R448_9BACT|nr:MAG: LysM peptidoglycan-binding domain-containing M23 family metallopeptidase [Micavibrio aeruginosavorus]